jgi:tRNA modification GTPase
LITASIDFPEEVDEPEYSFIENKISYLIEKVNFALDTAVSSNLMRNGLKVAIIGKPNAGKSSLFNALLNIDRAIVTDIPGTTRDIIQESLDIDGIPVTLIDTAGIRELIDSKDNYIESIGINIAKSYIKEADIILFVYDLSDKNKAEDKDYQLIYNEIKDKPVIKIGSKSDLLAFPVKNSNLILVSSKTFEGINLVKKSIKDIVLSNSTFSNTDFSINIRQQECLEKTKASLLQALSSSKNREVQDFIAIDLKSALISLGEIVGEVVSDEIINNIFDNFCIGK